MDVQVWREHFAMILSSSIFEIHTQHFSMVKFYQSINCEINIPVLKTRSAKFSL